MAKRSITDFFKTQDSIRDEGKQVFGLNVASKRPKTADGTEGLGRTSRVKGESVIDEGLAELGPEEDDRHLKGLLFEGEVPPRGPVNPTAVWLRSLSLEEAQALLRLMRS